MSVSSYSHVVITLTSCRCEGTSSSTPPTVGIVNMWRESPEPERTSVSGPVHYKPHVAVNSLNASLRTTQKGKCMIYFISMLCRGKPAAQYIYMQCMAMILAIIIGLYDFQCIPYIGFSGQWSSAVTGEQSDGDPPLNSPYFNSIPANSFYLNRSLSSSTDSALERGDQLADEFQCFFVCGVVCCPNFCFNNQIYKPSVYSISDYVRLT